MKWYKMIEFMLNPAIFMILVACGFAGYLHYAPQKQPDSFDSMLCRVHTPTAALLINDELITCTNGKKYRVTKNQ
jgi:hypothetical protein